MVMLMLIEFEIIFVFNVVEDMSNNSAMMKYEVFIDVTNCHHKITLSFFFHF